MNNLLVVLIGLVIQPVHPVCGSKATLLGYLHQMFGERVVAEDEVMGDTDRMVIMTSNKATGSWSMLQVWTNGTACMVRSGTGAKAPEWS